MSSERHVTNRPYLFVSLVFLATLSLALPSFAIAENAQVFKGRIEISTLNNGDLQIVVDELPTKGQSDGLADHVFILQRQDPIDSLTLSLAEARVIFAERRLTISTADQDLLFTIDDSDSDSSAPVKGFKERSVFVGVGLSHHFGGFKETVDELVERGFRSESSGDSMLIVPDGGSSFGCQAGGVGANSCSIQGCSGAPSSCSVSCNSPHFACCKCSHSEASCECKI